MTEGAFNSSAWNELAWNGPGATDFVMPTEIVCIEAEVVFEIELEGEIPVCDDE